MNISKRSRAETLWSLELIDFKRETETAVPLLRVDARPSRASKSNGFARCATDATKRRLRTLAHQIRGGRTRHRESPAAHTRLRRSLRNRRRDQPRLRSVWGEYREAVTV